MLTDPHDLKYDEIQLGTEHSPRASTFGCLIEREQQTNAFLESFVLFRVVVRTPHFTQSNLSLLDEVLGQQVFGILVAIGI